MKYRALARLLVPVSFLFLAISPALPQVSAGDAQLNGSVRDQTGSVIVKAKVTLRNLDTNQTYTASSNTVGLYIVTNIPPGNYEVTVEAPGFARFSQAGMALRVGQMATLDVNMKVAGAAEQVVVNTEAPVIEPTRTEVSQVIET